MPLSCSCDYDEGYEWYWSEPSDYQVLATKRCRKCSSCRNRIAVGELCTEFERTRDSNSDIEESLYGNGPDAVPLASFWLCEECSDLWFSLAELGFDCVSPAENMRQMAAEYASMKWRG